LSDYANSILATDSDTSLVPRILAACRNAACNARAAVQEQRYSAPSASAVNASRIYLVALARVPDLKARAGSRETLCLKCVCSALKRISTGEYFDTAGCNARCLRCSYRHKCKPVPKHLQLLARRFIDILINRTFKGKISNLRSAIKVIFKLKKEKKEEKEEKEDNKE